MVPYINSFNKNSDPCFEVGTHFKVVNSFELGAHFEVVYQF